MISWRRALQFAPDRSLEASWFQSYEGSSYGGQNSIDMQEIDRPDSSYDFISLSLVLEFVPDDRKAFGELMRVGSESLILHCTFSSGLTTERTTHTEEPAGAYGHYHDYGRDFEQWFETARHGLSTVVVRIPDPVTGDTTFALAFLCRRRTDTVTLAAVFAGEEWAEVESLTPVRGSRETPSELPLVLMFDVRSVSDGDRENLAGNVYSVRGTEIELVPPVDWQMDPYDNLSWRFWFHTLEFLDVPLRIYEQEGDLEALGKARDLALDWVSGNPIGGERTGDYAWFDMSAGMRAAFLGYAWRECRRNDLLEPIQEGELTAALYRHAGWLSDNENYTPETNHGLFEDAGLYLMGTYAAELSESAAWREFAEARFLETLSRHIQFEEGVHKEHSPGYHFYLRDLVKRLNAAGIGGKRLSDLAGKLDAAAGWMVLPDGTMTPFGDTDLTEAPAFAREAAGEEGLRAFPETGYAFVRRNGSYLGVTCSYHTYAHKHADELSWCLFENGHLVVGEAGRYGYRDEKDPARIYARASHGHNVLIVDDESFEWRGRDPYGSGLLAFGEGEGWFAVLAHNPLLDHVDHRRLLLYRPGELVLVVDRVEADRKHTIDRRLHFGPDLLASKSGEAVVAKDGDGRPVATLIDGSDVPVEISLARGVEDPRMDGWTFPRDLTKVPSDAVTLRSTIASGLLLHGVATTSDLPAGLKVRDARSRRWRPWRRRRSEDDQFIVEIHGERAGSELRVTRTGTELRVESWPR